MTIEYSITLVLAICLLVAYLLLVDKKEFWLTLLYVCVTVVNLGYLLMSFAKTVEFAVIANDIVYLGSVFLSLCMLFTIVKLCGFKIKRCYLVGCITSAIVMFLIVASSPMLPLYYESVFIEIVEGSAKLIKEYGPLHDLYFIYLVGCFGSMIATIIYSVKREKHGTAKFAGFIAGIVCSNILVWLFEKFINWDFEFLSVSYIISELLLLLVYWMMQDYVHKSDILKFTYAEHEYPGVEIVTMPMEAQIDKIVGFVNENDALSMREREILEMILANKKRKEIAEYMHLSENTIKTYTRTLYAKIGVTSRKELYSLFLQNNT